LLANIARGLGASACAAVPGGAAGAVAEVTAVAAAGELTVVAAPNFDAAMLRGRLAGLGLAAGQTIVRDAWVSACAEQKELVGIADYLHSAGVDATEGQKAAAPRPADMPAAAPGRHRVRLGDVEVDAFGFGTMSLGASARPSPPCVTALLGAHALFPFLLHAAENTRGGVTSNGGPTQG